MLPGEVGDSGLQRADEMSHAISRTAAASRGGAEELLQGEPDDLRGLALHPPGRALQGSAEVIGQVHGQPGWHRSTCIVMQSDASCDAASTAEDFPCALRAASTMFGAHEQEGLWAMWIGRDASKQVGAEADQPSRVMIRKLDGPYASPLPRSTNPHPIVDAKGRAERISMQMPGQHPDKDACIHC